MRGIREEMDQETGGRQVRSKSRSSILILTASILFRVEKGAESGVGVNHVHRRTHEAEPASFHIWDCPSDSSLLFWKKVRHEPLCVCVG